MKVFADRLREKLASLGVSQLKMAQMIGVAPGTLSAYLKDEKCPTLEKAAQIAEALGVTVGWLCGEDVEETNGRVFLEHNNTYARLVQVLCEILDMNYRDGFCESTKMQTVGIGEEGVIERPCLCLISNDAVLYKFFKDRSRVEDLYNQHTIDREMLDAWTEKRMRELESKIIEEHDEQDFE